MNLFEEICENEQLNERPYSRTRSAIDSVKGKAKGMFGSGQVEQGAQEVGAEANRIWNDFKKYVGKKYGNSPASVTYDDVYRFFNGNDLNTKHLGSNTRRTFTPKDVGSAILAAARDRMDDYASQTNQDIDTDVETDVETQSRPTEDKPQEKAPVEQGNGSDLSDLSSDIRSLSNEERQALLNLIS